MDQPNSLEALQGPLAENTDPATVTEAQLVQHQNEFVLADRTKPPTEGTGLTMDYTATTVSGEILLSASGDAPQSPEEALFKPIDDQSDGFCEPLTESTAPTAALSRAFFMEQAALAQAQCSAGAAATGPAKASTSREVECPAFVLPADQLNQLMLSVSAVSNVEQVAALLPRNTAAAIAAAKASGGSLFQAVVKQFERCLVLLAGPSKPDWKCSRKSVAEAHPQALFDRLVPLANLVEVTSSIWTFTETEAATVASNLQALLVKGYECQQKLLAASCRRQSTRKQAVLGSTAAACRDSSDDSTRKDQSMEARALERICSGIDRSVRRGLTHSRSLLSSASGSAPLALAKLATAIGSRNGCVSTAVVPEQILLPLPTVTASTVAKMVHGPTDLEHFATTVDTLASSETCKQLLGSVEIRAAISVLFSLRALAIELSKQRLIDWGNSGARAVVAAAFSEAERCFSRLSVASNLHLIPGAANLHGDAVAAAQPPCAATTAASPPSPLHTSARIGNSAATATRTSPRPSAPTGVSGSSFAACAPTPVRRVTPATSIGDTCPSATVGGEENFGVENGAVAAIEARMEQELRELFRCFRSLYRAAGSLLGGPYAEADVQFELAGTSVIGIYVSTMSFLFFDELSAIANFTAPWLPQVRRKLKQQSAPVNQVVNNTIASATEATGTVGSAENAASGPQVARTSSAAVPNATASSAALETLCSAPIASLQQLLRAPASLCLTRAFEGRAILMLLFPSALASSGASKAAVPEKAPADRINRLLVWLLWEAGISNILEQFERQTRISPATSGVASHSDESTVDALVAAVLVGARVVHNKFVSSTHLFSNVDEVAARTATSTSPQLPPNCTWRGEEVLELCTRVGEALSLRHLGEIDLRGSRLGGTKTTPLSGGASFRLQKFLLENLAARTLPERSLQVSTRMLEALPKFVGEFLHQCLFYEPPIRAVEDLIISPDCNTMACSVAVGTRSTGQIADLITQMISTQKCAVAALLNSHANFRSYTQLEERVERLGQQLQTLSDGPLSRHTNQIKTHTNRLEEHTSELRTLRGLISTQQTLQANNAADIKRSQEHLLQMGRLSDHLSEVERLVTNRLIENDIVQQQRTESTVRETVQTALALEQQRVDALVAQSQKSSELSVERTATNGENRCAAMEAKVKQDLALLRDSTEKSLVLTRQVQRAFCDTVIARCRDELSAFLMEHLQEKVSECLRDLLRQQEAGSSGGRHRRFLSWGMSHSPAASVFRSGAPAPGGATSGVIRGGSARGKPQDTHTLTPKPLCDKRLDSTPPAPTTLINTTKWPFQGPNYSADPNALADELTSVADTSSVQDEAGQDALQQLQQLDPFLFASNGGAAVGSSNSYWDSASTSSAAAAPESLLQLGDDRGGTASSRSFEAC